MERRTAGFLTECELDISTPIDQSLGSVKESIEHIFSTVDLCSMATVSATNDAHINTCFYASTEDCRLIFFTDPMSRHGRNLGHNPSIAVTVYDTHQPWGGDICGFQGFGTAELLTGDATVSALSAYSARHPGMEQWAPTIDVMNTVFALRLYSIRIEQFTLIDELRFGKKECINGVVLRR